MPFLAIHIKNFIVTCNYSISSLRGTQICFQSQIPASLLCVACLHPFALGLSMNVCLLAVVTYKYRHAMRLVKVNIDAKTIADNEDRFINGNAIKKSIRLSLICLLFFKSCSFLYIKVRPKNMCKQLTAHTSEKQRRSGSCMWARTNCETSVCIYVEVYYQRNRCFAFSSSSGYSAAFLKKFCTSQSY